MQRYPSENLKDFGDNDQVTKKVKSSGNQEVIALIGIIGFGIVVIVIVIVLVTVIVVVIVNSHYCKCLDGANIVMPR